MENITRRNFMKLAGAAAMGAAVGNFADTKGAVSVAEAKGMTITRQARAGRLFLPRR